jgi:DNA-binding NtrC family response regulator
MAETDFPSFHGIIGRSAVMQALFRRIERVGPIDVSVLIVGESGTGKELVARAIQRLSRRSERRFETVNCGALTRELLLSELFGHERGAFTGAEQKKAGLLGVADGGTVFLDEVGDLPLDAQVMLLRFLQSGEIRAVGSTEARRVDVRVIAATHRDLDILIRDGKFRDDLYYRLNVIRIELPPLRERTEDIPVLAAHFCQRFARPGHPPAEISPEAMEVLLKCPWPGNVRQLENAIERACVTARDGVIRPQNLPSDVGRRPETKHPFQVDLSRTLPDQLNELTAAYEERYIRRALRKTRGHVGKCAKLSGLSRRSITDKIAQYQIDKATFKKDDE